MRRGLWSFRKGSSSSIRSRPWRSPSRRLRPARFRESMRGRCRLPPLHRLGPGRGADPCARREVRRSFAGRPRGETRSGDSRPPKKQPGVVPRIRYRALRQEIGRGRDWGIARRMQKRVGGWRCSVPWSIDRRSDALGPRGGDRGTRFRASSAPSVTGYLHLDSIRVGATPVRAETTENRVEKTLSREETTARREEHPSSREGTGASREEHPVMREESSASREESDLLRKESRAILVVEASRQRKYGSETRSAPIGLRRRWFRRSIATFFGKRQRCEPTAPVAPSARRASRRVPREASGRAPRVGTNRALLLRPNESRGSSSRRG